MIHAPDAVVSLWEAEAVRALAAADRAADPTLEVRLSCAATEVRELVVFLAGELARAASVLRGSAIQATPEGAAVFLAGVDRLARELDGDLPLGGFTPGSGLAWKECCAGDSGCEGGTS